MGDASGGVGGDNGDILHDWELGLPNMDDLTPLSQLLVPLDLASAFSLSPPPSRSMLDVHHASRSTFRSLVGDPNAPLRKQEQDEGRLVACSEDDDDDDEDRADGGTTKRRMRVDCSEEDDDGDSRVGNEKKRPRLVWTPQLHKRFVDVVAHLGINNAVPKTIMHLMNVHGLTRENVASHLQKYRLYRKRMHDGLSADPPPSSSSSSSSEHLLPSSLNPTLPMPIPPPFAYNHQVMLGLFNGNAHHLPTPTPSSFHSITSYPYTIPQKRDRVYSSAAPSIL